MVRSDRASKRLRNPLLALVLLLPATASPALANEAQLWILNAGVSLGMAKAQMRLVGESTEPEVVRSLGAARDSMLQAQRLFFEPLASLAAASTTRAVAAIDDYSKNTQGASANAKDGYIAGIFSVYRPGFESTFDSSRPDAVHQQANCDLYMLLTGYAYGQAWIAATQPGSRARFYQTRWVGEVHRHIQNGILVSMDKGNVMVRPTVESAKVCCCFGMRSQWERLPTFTRDSPAALFASTLEAMRAVVRSAGAEGCLCGGGGVVPPTPPPPTPPPPPPPKAQPIDLSGEWNGGMYVVTREGGQYVVRRYAQDEDFMKRIGYSYGMTFLVFDVNPQRFDKDNRPIYAGKKWWSKEKYGQHWLSCELELQVEDTRHTPTLEALGVKGARTERLWYRFHAPDGQYHWQGHLERKFY